MSGEIIIDRIRAAGKYELREENFEGMNAYSFVARHLHLKRDVFLKVYDAVPEEGDVFLEPRSFIEATSNSGGCPYLVEVLDAEFLGDDYVLIAMELVDGGSILSRISDGPFRLMDAIEVAKNILQGVSHLHSSRFLHRDIKPANIIIADMYGRLHPKIGDFGSMAKLNSGETTVVASRHSPLYVPPEAWGEQAVYCFQSDIYQVGMVLYEMINGALPYEEEHMLDNHSKAQIKKCGCKLFSDLDRLDQCRIVDESICRRAKSRKLLSLVQKKPYLYGGIQRIINAATNPDLHNRYKKAVDMHSALNQIHVPNWFSDGALYKAMGWHGWDWEVEETVRRNKPAEYVVRKSRCGANSFRKCYSSIDIVGGFNYVLSCI
jgi:serine/threonine protein kinase